MARLAVIRAWLRDLSSLLWPELCLVCGHSLVAGEEIMCTSCRHSLPRCYIHPQEFNTIHQRLMPHSHVHRAAAWFYYHRSAPHTRLILQAKYAGRPDIIRHLARDFASEIAPDGFFSAIDAVVPVPLHPSKLRSRGYNQSLHLALGITDATGIPVSQPLIASRRHSTQTRRDRFSRWLNSSNTFSASSISASHILLVDDVCTTGSTLAACCQALRQTNPHITISALTLGLSSE